MTGRGNGRRRVTASAQIKALKRQMHGHRNNIRHVAPPQITKRPWYPLVVDFIEPTANVGVFFTPEEIVVILLGQLGLATQDKARVNIKLQRVDVYAMPTGSSTDRPAVTLDASSVTPSIGDPATPGNAEVFYGIMKKLSDQGNLSDAAKCSYTWPAHMADQPLSANSIFTVVATSGNMPNTLTRFHLLWSTTDVAAPK
jgi:hypothetical protein